MFSRTDQIDGFHLKVSRTEKELFEEFQKTEEPDVAGQMHQYLVQAKGQPGGIKIDNRELWSKIEKKIDSWLADACAERRLKMDYVSRAREAIMHRLRSLFATTIRDELGGRRAS